MTPRPEPSRRRKTIISAALIGLSLGLALVIAVLIPKLRPSEVADAPPAAVPVRTLTLKEEDFQLTLEAYGTVRPVKLVMVSAEVGGRIAEVDEALRPGNIIHGRPAELREAERRLELLHRRLATAHDSANNIQASKDRDRAWAEARALVKQVRAGRARCAVVRIDIEDLTQRELAAQARYEQTRAQLEQLAEDQANVHKLLEIADRDVALARKEMQRAEGLVAGGSAPESARDAARLNLQRYEAAVENLAGRRRLFPSRRRVLLQAMNLAAAEYALAARALTRSYVCSPFDGITVERVVEAGQIVNGGGGLPGSPLFSVMTADEIEVPLHVPASRLAAIRRGQPVRLYAEAFPQERWLGTVTRIAPRVDALNRTVPVYVRAPAFVEATAGRPAQQGDSRLRPGMFVRGEILLEAAPRRVIRVPKRYVIDGAAFVAVTTRAAAAAKLTNETHVASRRVLKVLFSLADDYLLEPGDGGLRAGERLILSNLHRLEDGKPVRPASDGHASDLTPQN